MGTPSGQPGLTQGSRPRAALALTGWLLLCFAVAAVSSAFTAHGLRTWYPGLIKPPLNPPNWVFASVWTILYAMMAVAVWLVWKTRPSRCRPRGIGMFLAQLWLNLLWSWIFFGLHQIGMALVDSVVLLIAILLTIQNFRKMSNTAAWLMVPYLAWVTFATYLNLAFWRLN